jgi:hypothetical protein
MVFTTKEHTAMTSSSLVRGSLASQALRQSPHPALRKLSVEETEVAIVISGSVSSYYLKQLAQEAILAVHDQRQLHNRVTVVRD